MPELCSEDKEDPLNEDKFLRSQEHKAQDRAEALQCLAPLLSPPKSAPESQAECIVNTPEAESEPAEAHELTRESTTDATDPTISDGGGEGDGDTDYNELEAMYRGAPTCRNDRCKGIFPSAAPEHHSPHQTNLGQAQAWRWMQPW